MKQLSKRIAVLCMCICLMTGLAAADGEITIEIDGIDDMVSSQVQDTSEEENQAEALTPQEEEAVAELMEAMEDAEPSEEVDLTNLEINQDLPDNVTNILLLGIDNRSSKLQRGLSDAVMICSVNKNTGRVQLTSFARDTAVSIPGYNSQRRINAAYKYGGPELAMRTINRNFKLNVQRYVVVNIHGLANVIDALGGVDIEMSELEARRINYELIKEPMDKVEREDVQAFEGLQHVDGMQAVTFARIRGLDNDLERTHRQRRLLEALFKQVSDIDLFGFMSLIETALPYVESNLATDELMTLGLSVLSGETIANIGGDGEIIGQLRIPLDKRYGYKTINNSSVIYLNEKNKKISINAIHEFIYDQKLYEDVE
ncbi:MAG: LCP family protein [Clostridiales bacterium]|nr:LCP family protein [Clostridiales bacterium]